MTKNIRRLSQADFYRLCELIKDRDIQDLEGKTYQQVADETSAELGTPVSAKSVEKASDLSGVAWRTRTSAQQLPTKERVAELENQVRQLVKMIAQKDIVACWDLVTSLCGLGAFAKQLADHVDVRRELDGLHLDLAPELAHLATDVALKELVNKVRYFVGIEFGDVTLNANKRRG